METISKRQTPHDRLKTCNKLIPRQVLIKRMEAMQHASI